MDIKTKGRMLMMAQKQGRLPSAYQEVEWIQSDSYCAIDTGYILNTDSVIEIKFAYQSRDSYSACGVNYDGKRFQLFNNGTYNYGRLYSTYDVSFLSTAIGTEQIYVIDAPSRKATQTQSGISFLASIQQPLAAPTLSLYIFAQRNGVSSYSTAGPSRFWYFTAHENGELMCSLVPCYRKSDNEIGLYDLVSQTFYTNQGTGTFTKGADVN